MRVCRSCGLDESHVRFYDRDSTSGKAAGSMCQPCWVAKSVTWRSNNRERWNAQRHKVSAMRTFGLTEDEYDYLYADPVCAGCGATKGANGRLVIDHNHATGKVRGLLCHDCNRTIATAHDDPDILRGLATYLDES